MDDIALVLGFKYEIFVMSEPSDWPLSKDAVRIIVPRGLQVRLENHALGRGLYPLALGYYPKAHRHSMKRENHDDYLLMYCMDGEGVLTCNQSEWKVQAGQIALLAPGQLHAYAARSNNPWSLFWFHFLGDEASAFCDELLSDRHSPMLPQTGDLTLQSLFRSLMATVTSGYSQPIFIYAANQMRGILSYLAWSGNRQAHRNTVDSVARVSAFMRQNLHRNLTLDELAESSGLSKYYFNRRYKALTGHSPMQHFTHMKVEQACLLLEAGGAGIAEIGFQLGYEDSLYFSRVFRKVLGISPSEYRERTMAGST